MKRLLLFQFLFVIFFSAFISAQTVHITKSGSKYHSSSCSYLKSDIPIDLSDALARGYSPCSRCNPPSSSKNDKSEVTSNSGYSGSSVQKENKSQVTSGRCQATTKKGSQCKRNAKSGSNYCWQHGG